MEENYYIANINVFEATANSVELVLEQTREKNSKSVNRPKETWGFNIE